MGFGINIDGELFKSDIINVIRTKQSFNFRINGSGSKNLISLNNNGFSTSGLDGKGNSFYQEKTYYLNGTPKDIRYKLTNDEKFNYFSFNTEGYADTEIDFHRVSQNLSLLNRFRLLVGLGYSIGFNHYFDSYDVEKRDFVNYPGFVNGDKQYKKTQYNFNHNIYLGGNLPIELDLRPIKEVQIKFSYRLGVLAHFQKYDAQYSEELIQNGSDNSFYDPLISYTSNSYKFDHTIGFRFRYEFPKVVRLSLGTYYQLSHSVIDNKIYLSDNKRKFVSGSEISGPYYSENIKNFDSSIYPYNNPLNTNSLTQKIMPTLELDFEFIKDFATLTVGWQPLISWDFANPKNEELIASNILNLANWSISNVIKFQPKDIEKINSQFRPIVKKQDTDDMLVILHTNDTHGHPIATIDGGGIPARVNIVKEIRSQYKNVLLLDAGDINTGGPESNYFFAEPDILSYNYINYDAMAIGNHEFDIPVKNLQNQMNLAKFPFLSANVKTKDGKYLGKEDIIKNFKNFKVGIFGLTTKETEIIGNKDNIKDIIFEDEVETAKKMVDILWKEKCDIIIDLVHLGIYDDDERGSKKLAKYVPGINLIIDGHSHTKMTDPVYVNDTPIIQAWKDGKIVGKGIVNIKNKKMTNLLWEPIPVNLAKIVRNEDGGKKSVTVGKSYEEDKNLIVNLRKYQEKVDKLLSEVVGKSTGDYVVTSVRKEQTPIGDLVCDAMKNATKEFGVDFAITNSGGIRADLLRGGVTKKSIYEVLPFDNTIVVVKMSGYDLLTLFNYIAKIKQGSGAFPQVSDGVEFTINFRDQIFQDIKINGTPIDFAKEDYKVAINSYMLEGGDGYEMFSKSSDIYDTAKYQRDALIDYIKEHKTITPIITERIKLIGNM